MDDPASTFLLFQEAAAAPLTAATVIINFVIVAILVALNAFFVCAEFSLVSARKQKIQSRADEGSKSAKAALRLLNDPTKFISAVQLGVTLASLGLGWKGEPTIAALLEPLAESIANEGTAAYITHGFAILLAFAGITFLHVVFGELVPKMFALERAESFAVIAARPLELFAKIFSPILAVLNYAGGLVGKILGLSSSLEHTSVYTEDEIRQLVALSQESGQINEEERTLINKVFEFSETTVREAMIPRTEITAIPATSGLDEIAAAFSESGYSRIPVYNGSLDEIAGVVHSKDLVSYIRNKRAFRLDAILHKPNYVVDTARLEDVLRQMQNEKFHFGFVVDEHGGVEGIITLEDLLEEIVGDISDEHDVEVDEQIDEQPDGSYILDGGLAVRDLNRRLEISLPVSEGYTTIAGFLMSEAGQILEAGSNVPYNGHVFTVEKVDKRRIKQVRLTAAPNAAGEGD
jgi:CBS domain containing-hemolysin-like protein